MNKGYLKKVKKIIEDINQEEIEFDHHFYKRTKDRPINEGMVRSFLAKPKKLRRIRKRQKTE